jgi:hypothetical protein
MGHGCLDFIESQTKIRLDLRETPFLVGLRLFVDGSSRFIQGKRHSRYSVVDRVILKVIKSGRLPNNWSAQTCDLFTFSQVLNFLKDK